MNDLDSRFYFKITHQDSSSQARCGLLSTPHGVIETPAFIFCATKAALKGVTPAMARTAKTQVILSNTYHLMLQPGPELIARQGGLHGFMGWDGPLLTDSGGFQIFSLGHGSVAEEIKGKRSQNPDRSRTLLKISEVGAQFRAYTDGKIHCLSPELAISIQHQLGADLILVLDECTPFHVPKTYTEASMHLSHRWAKRSYEHYRALGITQQALYGIVQGGVYPDLRRESSDFINQIDFFGQAIGGSLGSEKSQMYDIVVQTQSHLRKDRPTHLLGIGGLEDIIEGVKAGIDTFDCVHPTRLARHGGALVNPEFQEQSGRPHIQITRGRYQKESDPIELGCGCEVCQRYSRAYLHHLFKAKELLGMTLLSIHNIYFMNNFMEKIRQNIKHASA